MKTAREKFCPVCKNKNPASAVLCEACGASLEDLVQPHQTTVPMQGTGNIQPAFEQRLEKLDSDLVPPHGIAIYVMGELNPIATLEGDEMVFGRQTAEGPSNILDLSPYGAFDLGVSRQHSLLRKSGDGYEIVDLNSTNGTWLNKNQLVPNRPYPIKGNVLLRLGKLVLFLVHPGLEKA